MRGTSPALGLAAILLAGCAVPYPMYDGGPRPLEEVAVINALGGATVLRVDRREVPPMEQAVALEPGTRVILFRVRRSVSNLGGRGSTDGSTKSPELLLHCFVRHDFAAGQWYEIRSRVLSKRSIGSPGAQAIAGGTNATRLDAGLEIQMLETATNEAVPGIKCNEGVL